MNSYLRPSQADLAALPAPIQAYIFMLEQQLAELQGALGESQAALNRIRDTATQILGPADAAGPQPDGGPPDDPPLLYEL